MEMVWENDDYIIYSDGAIYYAYQRQDVINAGWELTEYFFCSPSLCECLVYTKE